MSKLHPENRDLEECRGCGHKLTRAIERVDGLCSGTAFTEGWWTPSHGRSQAFQGCTNSCVLWCVEHQPDLYQQVPIQTSHWWATDEWMVCVDAWLEAGAPGNRNQCVQVPAVAVKPPPSSAPESIIDPTDEAETQRILDYILTPFP